MSNTNKMPEAEVSIRLAHFLLLNQMAVSPVRVAIDGAQVKTDERIHFQLESFMNSLGWVKSQSQESGSWRGRYTNQNVQGVIEIHSSSGQGDVSAQLNSGQTLIAESKKGSMMRSKSSEEYPLMREAIGQLMTIDSLPDNPLLSVAVPHGEKFIILAERWRKAPLIQQAGIKILTIAQTGEVYGF